MTLKLTYQLKAGSTTLPNNLPLTSPSFKVHKAGTTFVDSTTTSTTSPPVTYPKETACSQKKAKKLDCADRNMHSGAWLINYIMKLTPKERSKIKNLDISKNPNLSIVTLMGIIGHLDNLSSISMRFNGYTQLPANIFENNRKIKSLDVTGNDLICVRGAFKNLKMKKMSFADNDVLIKAAGGAKKGKKSKLTKYIEKWQKLPRENCEDNLGSVF